MKDRGVIVTHHARDQLRARFPELADRDPIGLIFAEVKRAVEAGRLAARKPRWVKTVGIRGKGHTGEGTHRYCWNLEQSRCYILRLRKKDGREAWVVKTVIRPGRLSRRFAQEDA